MRLINFLGLIVALLSSFTFSFEKAISGIAPEFQEAAQKRQDELLRQRFCTEKAANENVVKRDLASFVLVCIDKIEKANERNER